MNDPAKNESSNGSTSLRVITIGLAGRERSMRGPGVELIRTANGLEALGELGPREQDPTHPTIVVVEPRNLGHGELDELTSSLRRLDDSIRIVAMNAGGSAPPEASAALDGFVSPGIDASGLRRFFDTPEPPADPPPTHEPERPATSPLDTELGSTTALLQAVLSGRNLPMTYVDGLSNGPIGELVTYVDVAEGIPRPAEEPGRFVVDVARRGTRFGWLIGPREAQETLRRAADELALCVAVQKQQEQLRDSAFKDHLTGAWNRRYFDRYLNRSIADAKARRRDLTLLLFDIDDFKHYNDSYGHAAGDDILVETVRLLRAVTRPSDEVCRIGGDEFAVIFYEPEGPREPGSRPPSSVFSIAHRFRQQICAHKFPKLGELAPGRLTISGGLATFPWDGSDPQSLIEHADRLAMQSKREGKNVICLGPGAMRMCVPERERPTD